MGKLALRFGLFSKSGFYLLLLFIRFRGEKDVEVRGFKTN